MTYLLPRRLAAKNQTEERAAPCGAGACRSSSSCCLLQLLPCARGHLGLCRGCFRKPGSGGTVLGARIQAWICARREAAHSPAAHGAACWSRLGTRLTGMCNRHQKLFIPNLLHNPLRATSLLFPASAPSGAPTNLIVLNLVLFSRSSI